MINNNNTTENDTKNILNKLISTLSHRNINSNFLPALHELKESANLDTNKFNDILQKHQLQIKDIRKQIRAKPGENKLEIKILRNRVESWLNETQNTLECDKIVAEMISDCNNAV